MKTAIPLETTLRIQWRFEQFSGIVKYCRKEGREFLVGIQRDSAKITLSDAPLPQNALPPQSIKTNAPQDFGSARLDPAQPDAKISSPRQEARHTDDPERQGITEVPPPVRPSSNAAVTLPYGFAHKATNANLVSRPQEFITPRQTEPRPEPPPKRKEAVKERKLMGRKWLGLAPWHNKPDDSSANGDEIGNRTIQKENSMPQSTSPAEKAPLHSAREVPTFQVELLPMEDIYQAAGIVTPRKGYGVNKVVEMLNSDHLRGLSKEMRRAAVLMALDAAGITLDRVQRDAKARQDALDTYEAEQKQQAETEWARKAEEVAQIQSELDSIKAHYMARINRSLESVSRDKVRFSSWVTTKDQETRNMTEAVELCLKSPVSEAVSFPVTELRLAASAGVGAEGSKSL
jgi:hypothetical protein